MACTAWKDGDSLTLSMRLRAFIQMMMERVSPFAQRTVAFLMLAVVALVVIDPIWECHDHLDALRHLGPHGMLVILLMVALASVLLLKSPLWLLFSIRCDIAGVVPSRGVSRTAFVAPLFLLTPESGPPLRI